MKCNYAINPAGGFAAQHSRVICGHAPCENPPVAHVYVGSWCGNVCKACSEQLCKSHRDAKIVDEVFAMEEPH